jgi:hypothetical protein
MAFFCGLGVRSPIESRVTCDSRGDFAVITQNDRRVLSRCLIGDAFTAEMAANRDGCSQRGTRDADSRLFFSAFRTKRHFVVATRAPMAVEGPSGLLHN